jgi:hypothetical protein
MAMKMSVPRAIFVSNPAVPVYIRCRCVYGFGFKYGVGIYHIDHIESVGLIHKLWV